MDTQRLLSIMWSDIVVLKFFCWDPADGHICKTLSQVYPRSNVIPATFLFKK